ncbi:hypothetical protein JX266_013033 [Neoarthrinium moseri]|nr:hypothetical protein JX266_013033 [Neoarthrinium moseri]
MQFKNLALSLFVASVAAQDINSLITQVPTCALSCLLNAGAQVGCDTTDYSCQCSKADALKQAVEPCLAKSCSAEEIGNAQSVSEKICAAVGAVSSVSSAVASATSALSSAASSASASASASASTAVTTGSAGRVEVGVVAAAAGILAFAL